MLYRGDFLREPPKGGGEIGRGAIVVAQEEMKESARELGGNNSGMYVKKYMGEAKYESLKPENRSWCAAFVSYCFHESAKRMEIPPPFEYKFGAREIFNWGKNKRYTFTEKLPEPGDIVTWWRSDPTSWQAHVGIVFGATEDWLYTIEGNHTSAVEGFSYPLKTCMMAGLKTFIAPEMKKLLAYIHIPSYHRSNDA